MKHSNVDKVKMQNRLANRRYRLAHPGRTNLATKRYRLANPEKAKESRRKYYSRNFKREQSVHKIWHNNQIKTNPVYRCKCSIRSLIKMSIKGKGYNKNSKTQQILGCSFDQFKTYIESKFTKGMTWLNHGEWHIDHIKPLALAQSRGEVIKLCHYDNLQPLWATSKVAEKYGEVNYIGNLEKGNR
jgi:hypothetical protein